MSTEMNTFMSASCPPLTRTNTRCSLRAISPEFCIPCEFQERLCLVASKRRQRRRDPSKHLRIYFVLPGVPDHGGHFHGGAYRDLVRPYRRLGAGEPGPAAAPRTAVEDAL